MKPPQQAPENHPVSQQNFASKSLKSIIQSEKPGQKRVLKIEGKEKPQFKKTKVDNGSTIFDNVGSATDEQKRMR